MWIADDGRTGPMVEVLGMQTASDCVDRLLHRVVVMVVEKAAVLRK